MDLVEETHGLRECQRMYVMHKLLLAKPVR